MDEWLDHGRLSKQVTKESSILCLFKEYSKPLAIKQQGVEEAEDKDIESLFDDCVVPNKEEKKMEVEQPVQKSYIKA